MSDRYRQSEAMLLRALQSIPLGSQTFSKSLTQYPRGVSPYFLTHGKGSRVWDVDGNEYIDFVNGLASITLGYNDPDVNAAVRKQLDEGTIFSLAHPIEISVAEKIVEMVPCAEMVRFGKNGSDVTSGAVRLARAYTGRDHVAVSGYHGWQDWYIGSTARNKGVPEAVRSLTHSFPYNDLPALQKLFDDMPGQIAAVILEPMNVFEPKERFLEQVKALAHDRGALLIFDETITGFRYAKGGAQELFAVTPDLATFGKGVANGYPLSVIAGRRDVMKLMEEIFFSFTFGGETLSLAASLATLTKLQNEPVLETIAKRGQVLLTGLKELIERHRLGDTLETAGHPSWSFIVIKDTPQYSQWLTKTFMLQELFARGILYIGSHNLSYAHSDEDIQKLLGIYDEIFGLLAKHTKAGSLEAQLRCEPLRPLFRVR
jgi:glutamate-1-semialdehyde 2,1-aminomutase